jgi:hypothetical protein
MPIQTTNFPSKHFDEQFAQACSDVREYFREAWSIAKRVAAHIKSKSRPKGSKRVKGKGRISMGKVIVEVMHEDNAKPSSVYDARKCGATFDETDVERILALCKEAGLLPSRQLFLELMRVPADDRESFAEQVIRDRSSKEEIKLRRHQAFSKKAKGNKVPHAPTSQFELTSQLTRHFTRLNHLFGLMCPPRVGGKKQSSKLGFTVPADVEAEIKLVMRGLKAIEEKCRREMNAGSEAA